jgi:DNA transposition AAA+ family ATPase
MAPDCAGVTPALEEIALGMGLEVQGGAAAHRRAIVRRLIDAGDNGALLIIDEAQHLGTAAFDEIRTLHDRASAGIAYLGNRGVWAQLVGGGRKGEALDRVHSRIGARVHSTGASKQDIAAMLDAWRIKDRAARAALGEIAKRPGALRAATKAIRTATLFAAGAPLTVEHVRAAAAERGV